MLSLGIAAPWADSATTAITSAAGDVTGFMTTVLPIALGVFALQWGVRKGIKFFKSSAN
jgi:MFS-type transporter involved in bile tolerance (Atg22 family)